MRALVQAIETFAAAIYLRRSLLRYGFDAGGSVSISRRSGWEGDFADLGMKFGITSSR